MRGLCACKGILDIHLPRLDHPLPFARVPMLTCIFNYILSYIEVVHASCKLV